MDRMLSEEQFVCFNVRDFLNPEETSGIGENDLEEILSNFYSPKNSDVEFFLKRNAVEFTRKNQSVTYLVFSLHDIQRQLGGLMVYLECEEKEPLLKFYQEQNGFRHFGERLTAPAILSAGIPMLWSL